MKVNFSEYSRKLENETLWLFGCWGMQREV